MREGDLSAFTWSFGEILSHHLSLTHLLEWRSRNHGIIWSCLHWTHKVRLNHRNVFETTPSGEVPLSHEAICQTSRNNAPYLSFIFLIWMRFLFLWNSNLEPQSESVLGKRECNPYTGVVGRSQGTMEDLEHCPWNWPGHSLYFSQIHLFFNYENW